MKYKLYLFDFDYTLADSSRGIVICFRNVLTKHGHTKATDYDIKRTIGKTLEDSFSILTGITEADTLHRYRLEYGQEADKYMTANTRLFDETQTVLETLKQRGAQLGIISTKYRFRIQDLLKNYFAEDFFDLIVGNEDVQTPKPSPEGINFALNRLQTAPENALYVGDSTVDAETARNAALPFAAVLHGLTTADELAAFPHVRIMKDLTELV